MYLQKFIPPISGKPVRQTAPGDLPMLLHGNPGLFVPLHNPGRRLFPA
jgi:hypothetical protein